jgi:hypothetical protein
MCPSPSYPLPEHVELKRLCLQPFSSPARAESEDVAALLEDLGEKVAELQELAAQDADTKSMIKARAALHRCTCRPCRCCCFGPAETVHLSV